MSETLTPDTIRAILNTFTTYELSLLTRAARNYADLLGTAHEHMSDEGGAELTQDRDQLRQLADRLSQANNLRSVIDEPADNPDVTTSDVNAAALKAFG